MVLTNKKQVASLIQERRRAMEGCRFKPENYHEIHRVLGARFAPDLNRVVSKHRANAASAYLRRLHRDVEKSQEGYYDQMQAMPLQIIGLTIRKEDPRNFKSVLIPKLKLSPLKASPRQEDPSPSSRSQQSVFPVPPLVVQNGSNYVPHKYFSPHSHTHILFKQMPAATNSPRRGASSIVSSEKSSGSNYTEPKSQRSQPPSLKAGKLSPREVVDSKSPEISDPVWPNEDVAAPFSLPKFTASQAPLPNIKKRRVSVDKNPRTERNNPVPALGPRV